MREASLFSQAANLSGIVSQIVYHNEENAYTVLRLKVEDMATDVTAVGKLLSIQIGEELLLRGEWIHDARYGRQFRVENYERNQPSTLKGIRSYLSSMVKGIGPKLAERIVERFGLETLHIIEHEPHRLTEVGGFGASRVQQVLDAWSQHRGEQEVMVFLQGVGVSTVNALKIYKQYRQQALNVVRENPYRLAREVRGFGFKTADQIARSLGMPEDSIERAEAALLFMLEKENEDGHIFSPGAYLLQKTMKHLDIPFERLLDALEQLDQRGEVVLEPYEEDDVAIYRSVLAACERGAVTRIRRMLDRDVLDAPLTVEATIRAFEEKTHMKLATAQREAVVMAAQAPISIITGGPGTGKTTIVRAICAVMKARNAWVSLAAPTGRAAKRLKETTGLDAKTLHRLLEFSPGEFNFLRNEDRPLKTDMLIVDEASMLDIYMFYHVLRAVRPETQIVFVGDVDQLPSVGPGQVLRDLIDADVVPYTRLQQIFRQQEGGLIIENAHRVNIGETLIEVSDPKTLQDFYFIPRENPLRATSSIVHLVTERIPRRFGFQPSTDIQVIAPMHRGEVGVQNLNRQLQQALHPRARHLTLGGQTFCVGDRILQTRNDYDKEVFNGDVGWVESIDTTSMALSARFDGRLIPYERNELDDLSLAYAISVHKSQGSEYPAIVIPLFMQHQVMLQRNLLYTALTRGKRLVILIGQPSALKRAIQNDRTQQRHTRLAWRLKDSRLSVE